MSIYKRGIIKTLPAIVVKDPWYKNDVEYVYCNNKLPKVEYDFTCHIAEQSNEELKNELAESLPEGVSPSFELSEVIVKILISRKIDFAIGDKSIIRLDNKGVLYTVESALEYKIHEIGVDTARLYIGTNTDIDEYAESIHTGGDGSLGCVYSYIAKHDAFVGIPSLKTKTAPHGFISAYIELGFSADMVSERELYDYITAQFDITMI